VEIFGFIVVHGTLDATKGPVAVVEEDGWYFEIANHTIVQEPTQQG